MEGNGVVPLAAVIILKRSQCNYSACLHSYKKYDYVVYMEGGKWMATQDIYMEMCLLRVSECFIRARLILSTSLRSV